jgi:hypothetical protein
MPNMDAFNALRAEALAATAEKAIIQDGTTIVAFVVLVFVAVNSQLVIAIDMAWTRTLSSPGPRSKLRRNNRET